jgi:hypothetical protein
METKLIKKQIGQKNYNVKKIITDPEYVTSDEEFLLVQNTVKKVILNNSLTNHITIKSLSKIVVTCTENKIDEEYDEVVLYKGSCIQLVKVNNIWYIIGSDGLKLN